MIRGVRKANEEEPHHQFALENPAWSALRFDKKLIEYFREGVVVQGCAYGGTLTEKAYRFWMSVETLEVFLKLQILTDSDRSHCEMCKANQRHSQAVCPQKGNGRERESMPGEKKKATKNRVLTLLVAVIGRAMIEGRRRLEEREERSHRKRKR